MGFAEWFTIKSPAQREKDMREYEKWAFPYGKAQKEKLTDILKQLLPEEDAKAAMAVFLLGREGYLGSVKSDSAVVSARSEKEKLERTVRSVNSYLQGKKAKKLLSRYVAIIIADSKIGPELDYPTVEALRKSAQELEPVLAYIPR